MPATIYNKKVVIDVTSVAVPILIRLAEKHNCIKFEYSYSNNQFTGVFNSYKDAKKFFDNWVAEYGWRE